VGHITEQLHDLPPAHTVERGGRFVGENEAGLIGQGAGDGDSLLLAAGELGRHVERAAPDAQGVQQLHRAALGHRGWATDQLAHDLHILDALRNGIRLDFWNTKPMCSRRKRRRSPSDRGPSCMSCRRWSPRPAVGGLMRPYAEQEGGLAGAAGSQQGDDLAAPDAHATRRAGDHLGVPTAVHLGEAARSPVRAVGAMLGLLVLGSADRLVGCDAHRLPDAQQAREHRDHQHDARQAEQVVVGHEHAPRERAGRGVPIRYPTP
jgi:hypothetical protein